MASGTTYLCNLPACSGPMWGQLYVSLTWWSTYIYDSMGQATSFRLLVFHYLLVHG